MKVIGTEEDLTRHEYYVLVEVRDSGHPKREAFVGIAVSFREGLEFENTTYSVSVSEAVPTGTEFYTVRASDGPYVSYMFCVHLRKSIIRHQMIETACLLMLSALN